MGTENHTLLEKIEDGGILKTEEKSIRAREFLNILTDMILSYSQSKHVSNKVA